MTDPLWKKGRRSFLRSAATGLCLSVPAFELLRPRRARAQQSLRKLVLFHFPNGAHPEDWATAPVGPWSELPPLLTPLADHADGLVMLSGLSGVQASHDYSCSSGTPHALPVLSCLTGSGLMCGEETNVPSHRSVDFAAAEVLGPSSIPSLYVRPYGTQFNISISGPGPGTGVQPIRQPHLLFAQLFEHGDLSPEALEQLMARRASVLDYLVGEIETLEGTLGAADRQRLDHHLTTVRQLELEAQLGVEQCAAPETAPVDSPADPPDEQLPQRTDELMDLAITALRCDITDVLVFSVGMSQGVPTYSFLDAGTPPTDAHQTSHMQAGETPEEKRFWWLETNRYHLSKFARLLDLLAGSDGAEPMLDQTAAVCFSEMGMGGLHSVYNLPVIAAGGGIAGGRHEHYPCTIIDPSYGQWQYAPQNTACTDDGGQTPLANLWLTALRALGGDVDVFGESTASLDGLW